MSGNDSLVIGYPPRGRKRQDSRLGDDDDAHVRTAARRLSRMRADGSLFLASSLVTLLFSCFLFFSFPLFSFSSFLFSPLGGEVR